MVSTISLRPNHYEILGLEWTASGDEIAKAFAREISLFRPRPLGGLAEVSVAYETLRDPIKRRAYDSSLGLGSEPAPVNSLTELPERAPVPAPASAKLMERLAIDPPPAPEPRIEPPPRTEPRAGAGMAPFMAASLREPASSPGPGQLHELEPAERIRLEPQFAGDRALHPAKAERVPQGVDGPIEWNRPALAAGALLLSAAILGAWVGLEAGNDVQPEQTEPVVTTRLPPAEPLPIATAPPPAPAPSMVEARPERQTRAAPAKAETARTRPPLQITLPEEQPSEAAQFQQSQGGEVANDQTVPGSPSVEATAAKLPLPNAVVARTIRRIGYACGQVASTTAIEGEASGVFKVTCTSGHSYRAAPVRGRYHFRRLGSR